MITCSLNGTETREELVQVLGDVMDVCKKTLNELTERIRKQANKILLELPAHKV